MKEQSRYIALFDLDHTMFDTNSSHLLVTRAHKIGFLTTRDLIKGIWMVLRHKMGLGDTKGIIEQAYRWLEGVSEEEFRRFGNEIVEDTLIGFVHPEIREILKQHKERGADIVILSAALEVICEPIARHLEMDHVICSRLEIIDGTYTGQALGPPCIGEEKLIRVQEYCREHGYTLKDAYYYADSILDLPALEAVGHPICINPDKKLAAEAKQRNWTIHSWDGS
ncbi:MAG: HAD-IB family hydrolase [Acidobacteria bacterium]|nr:HAD-IB family hydrolase [Acidobacteriota bacterium]